MKIGFFGCSFTEGGGIDSEEWYQYAIKNGIEIVIENSRNNYD
jgi:hypothetical protein